MDWAFWNRVIGAIIADVHQPVFWLGVLQIIWVNILLSGDNAVVIALACRNLPPRQRMWGMAIGAGVAVALRIIFTLIVSTLMELPYLKLAGGVALCSISPSSCWCRTNLAVILRSGPAGIFGARCASSRSPT